ncbi:uncharacterized protein [Rutidosis leptorrhynchoides]|uniref:uncharacterized protein isoform X2 n=1 Tax=Rutidosis leptorrhynchoides TaxID=125765 RepID=UPI003A999BAC
MVSSTLISQVQLSKPMMRRQGIAVVIQFIRLLHHHHPHFYVTRLFLRQLKRMNQQAELVPISTLRPGQKMKIIEAVIYRMWILKRPKETRPHGYCCILISKVALLFKPAWTTGTESISKASSK